jgi:hypothetical protein
MTFKTVARIAVAVIAVALTVQTASAETATNLVCGHPTHFFVVAKPRDCLVDWPNLSSGDPVHLRRIAWSNWDHSTATGSALMRGGAGNRYTRVVVRAFDREPCPGMRRTGPDGRPYVIPSSVFFYTRLRIIFANGRSHTWRTADCKAVSYVIP